MSKERLKSAMQQGVITEVTTPPVMPLPELFQGDKGEWQRRWQDADFILSFPASIYRLISEHPPISENRQEEMFSHAFPAFAGTTLNSQVRAYLAPIRFTETGQLIRASNETQIRATDSLATANLGSLLLVGFGVANANYTKDVVIDSLLNVKPIKKYSLREEFFRLVTINCSTRRWLEANNLDGKRGFSWNENIPDLALSIPDKRVIKAKETSSPSLPAALKSPTQYVPKVIVQFLDHICQTMDEQSIKVRDNLDVVSAFISELENVHPSIFEAEDPSLFPKVQENLKVLKDLRDQLYKVKK